MATKRKAGGSAPASMALTADQQEEFNKKVKQMKSQGIARPGVIYVGHIPHGFFEEQMKGYFSQFGRITRLRISRSKKTGGIKGYAFIEFANEEVAKVVASAMNNYMMFHKLLKCQFLEPEKVHVDTFKGCDRPFAKPKQRKWAIKEYNTKQNPGQKRKATGRLKRRLGKTKSKLAAMGVEYSFDLKAKAEYPEVDEVKKDSSAKKPTLDTDSRERKRDDRKSFVLVDDPSDSEIDFITPPGTIHIKRKSRKPSFSAADATSENSPVVPAKKDKKSIRGPRAGRPVMSPVQTRSNTKARNKTLKRNEVRKN